MIARLGMVLASALALGCNVGFYQGQDHPDDANVLGPPPPADFHCDRGNREVRDTNKDTHPDTVLHIVDGNTICTGEDTNNDGKIDTWNRIDQGRIVEQAKDTDYNGTLDQRIVVPATIMMRDAGSSVPGAAH